MFKYAPAKACGDLRAQGYAHLKDVLSADFIRYLKAALHDALDQAAGESAEWHIKGKKRQFVFDFPDRNSAMEFRAAICALTGIAEAGFTISERHLKLYDAHANPFPAPHKDRSASHFSIGLPIHLPAGSTVCMFPDLQPGENTEDRAVFLAKDDPDEIAALYDSPQARMLDEEVGDMIVFWGSRLFHERVRGAGTAVLYIKVNGEGHDPLGENLYADLTVPA